jgi:hypothetical protein
MQLEFKKSVLETRGEKFFRKKLSFSTATAVLGIGFTPAPLKQIRNVAKKPNCVLPNNTSAAYGQTAIGLLYAH